MAFKDWMLYNDKEFIDVSRTVARARALGINGIKVSDKRVAEIRAMTGQTAAAQAVAANAPWYDSGYAVSQQFAGFLVVDIKGLGDSTREADVTEYITDGGHAGRARNSSNVLVFEVLLLASTDQGAEFGKRYLDRLLRSQSTSVFCSGADLDYFRATGDATIDNRVHLRNVSLTRAASITRVRRSSCQTVYTVQFTLTATDPYEYGEQYPTITSMGQSTATTGPRVTSEGSSVLVQQGCPAYDYSPIYDPLYPALIASPTAPNFLPDGWGISNGMNFQRKWARVTPVEPSESSLTVPVFKVQSTSEARMVRLQVFPGSAAPTVQCNPLFGAVIAYLPANLPMYLDGEASAPYCYDGSAGAVRRTDSLVYSPNAGPMKWPAFNQPDNLLVCLDLRQTTSAGNYQGGGNVRVSMALVPRSD